MPSSESEIPDRLRRRGRAEDPDFSASESLYMRVKEEQILSKGGLSNLEIRFPCQSVNRSKYSEPEDVLIGYNDRGFGVAAFNVGDIPDPYYEGSVEYRLKMSHVPWEENFAHSELQTFKRGKYTPTTKITSQTFKQRSPSDYW